MGDARRARLHDRQGRGLHRRPGRGGREARGGHALRPRRAAPPAPRGDGGARPRSTFPDTCRTAISSRRCWPATTVVFKPSRRPRSRADAWPKPGPRPACRPGVFNLIQGGRATGAALLNQPIDGLLFTGSARAGAHFRRQFVDRVEVILALELGGNNPLIVWDDADPQAAAAIAVQSAYVTTRQRCSCARRLVVPQGAAGERIVEAIPRLAPRLAVGAWGRRGGAVHGPADLRAARRDRRPHGGGAAGRGRAPGRSCPSTARQASARPSSPRPCSTSPALRRPTRRSSPPYCR